MRTVNYQFFKNDELTAAIDINSLLCEPHILIQVFDGRSDYGQFLSLAQDIYQYLPHTVIIGATTSGEIFGHTMCENSVVISISIFEKTQLIPIYAKECTYAGGIATGQELLEPNIKGGIFFSEGLGGKPELFLQAITSLRPDIILAGGAAGDNSAFKQTLIMLNGHIYERGIVGVMFANPDLLLSHCYSLSYNPIGKIFTITKAEHNRLYELDGRPIISVIEHYFGRNVLVNLPSSIVEFPLIKLTNSGIDVARAPIAICGDDALIYAGNIEVGDCVRFGVADVESILSQGAKLSLDIAKTNPEAIWIYSCMGRKEFLGKMLEDEFALFDKVAPTSGFFTYGEFYTGLDTAQMLNLTTTVLAIRESVDERHLFKYTQPIESCQSPIRSLTHFINTITTELDKKNHFLESYKVALDANSLVSKTDSKGVITYVNDLFIKVSGYSKEELIGQQHRITRHPDVPASLFEDMWNTITAGKVWHGVVRNRSKSGEDYYVDTNIIPLTDETGQIIEYIATRHDLTQIVNQQKTIQQQKTDALTGLPNRVQFFSDIILADHPIVALLNIDKFGEINHYYGFLLGDQVLVEFSKFIISILPDGYKLYRLEADNFLIYCLNINDTEFCDMVQNLLTQISQRYFVLNDEQIILRSSAGIAKGEFQILSRAEDALKKARLKHKDYSIARQDDESIKKQNFEMLKTLRDAIESRRIVPYYQPIVDANSGAIVKYESLMRLIDNDGKVYAPYYFLELAKQSRYYAQLTRIMIEKSFYDFAARSERLSINLSVEDIENPETVSFLKEMIINYPNPSQIVLEVTETEAVQDYETMIDFITQIKNLGVQISIDDFGSGYSNFAYLTRFNADYLKIDGSLVRKIIEDENSYQTVAAINDFAKRLGLKTVAEFVSSKEIADKLKPLGIDFYQGYFYGEPVANIK